MILFGVNTCDTFLWCVIGFTMTLKWTNTVPSTTLAEELWELDMCF